MKALRLVPVLAGLALVPQAHAQNVALPAATFGAEISTSIYHPPVGTAVAVSENDGQYNESASASALPIPVVTASAQSTAAHPIEAADAIMTYDFEIVSANSTYVMMDVLAAATTGGSGDYFAQAHVDLLGWGNLENAQSCGEGYNGCSPFSQIPTASGGTKQVFLATNTDYEIVMRVLVGVGFYGSTATAYADPTITFDPSYNNPADAKIVYSSNLPLTSVVPEPASWALIVAGFGAIGGTLRGRKRSSAHLA